MITDCLFQTEQYIKREWTKGFELLGVWAGRIDAWQDLVALRRSDFIRSDFIRVDPRWPSESRQPVQSVILKVIGEQLTIGKPIRLRARVVGGEDVHFRFFVKEIDDWFRPFTDWQQSTDAKYIPWFSREYSFVVRAASGGGMHSAAEASCSVLIEEVSL